MIKQSIVFLLLIIGFSVCYTGYKQTQRVETKLDSCLVRIKKIDTNLTGIVSIGRISSFSIIDTLPINNRYWSDEPSPKPNKPIKSIKREPKHTIEFHTDSGILKVPYIDHGATFSISLEDDGLNIRMLKHTVDHFPTELKRAFNGLIDCWYNIARRDGALPKEAFEITINKLNDKVLSFIDVYKSIDTTNNFL